MAVLEIQAVLVLMELMENVVTLVMMALMGSLALL